MLTRIEELLAQALRLQDREADDSVAASNPALDELTAESDFESLLRASRHLRSGVTKERQFYARLLAGANMPSDRRLAEVLHALENEADPKVIHWLVFGIRNAASRAALGKLRELAKHPSPDVRFPVPDALSACADRLDKIFDVLLELSHDLDPDVRWSAVFELGAWWRDTEDAHVRARLDDVRASDPSDEVRRAAAEATRSWTDLKPLLFEESRSLAAALWWLAVAVAAVLVARRRCFGSARALGYSYDAESPASPASAVGAGHGDSPGDRRAGAGGSVRRATYVPDWGGTLDPVEQAGLAVLIVIRAIVAVGCEAWQPTLLEVDSDCSGTASRGVGAPLLADSVTAERVSRHVAGIAKRRRADSRRHATVSLSPTARPGAAHDLLFGRGLGRTSAVGCAQLDAADVSSPLNAKSLIIGGPLREWVVCTLSRRREATPKAAPHPILHALCRYGTRSWSASCQRRSNSLAGVV